MISPPLLINQYCENLHNDTAKLAFQLNNHLQAIVNFKCKDSAVVMKGKKTSKQVGIVMIRNTILFDTLNEVMDKIIPSGIPEHIFNHGLWTFYKKFLPSDDNDPKVMTLGDLEYGFILWLFACCISSCGFVTEIMIVKLRRILVRPLIGLILFLRILSMRMSVYHG